LAESISINTKFTKVKSPYIGESHVAKHLAFDEIVPRLNNCGTCGLIGCSIEISTKGRGNSKQDKAKSNCYNFPV